MTVLDWVKLGLGAVAVIGVIVGVVMLVRWTSRSQAAQIAEKTEADKKDFDAQRAAVVSPTPEEKVAKLDPDETTDELNKL